MVTHNRIIIVCIVIIQCEIQCDWFLKLCNIVFPVRTISLTDNLIQLQIDCLCRLRTGYQRLCSRRVIALCIRYRQSQIAACGCISTIDNACSLNLFAVWIHCIRYLREKPLHMNRTITHNKCKRRCLRIIRLQGHATVQLQSCDLIAIIRNKFNCYLLSRRNRNISALSISRIASEQSWKITHTLNRGYLCLSMFQICVRTEGIAVIRPGYCQWLRILINLDVRFAFSFFYCKWPFPGRAIWCGSRCSYRICSWWTHNSNSRIRNRIRETICWLRFRRQRYFLFFHQVIHGLRPRVSGIIKVHIYFEIFILRFHIMIVICIICPFECIAF